MIFDEDQAAEIAVLSEPVLARDWSRPEEDAAWSHLLFAPSTHAQAAGCLRCRGSTAPTDAATKAAVRARAKRLDDAAKSG